MMTCNCNVVLCVPNSFWGRGLPQSSPSELLCTYRSQMWSTVHVNDVWLLKSILKSPESGKSACSCIQSRSKCSVLAWTIRSKSFSHLYFCRFKQAEQLLSKVLLIASCKYHSAAVISTWCLIFNTIRCCTVAAGYLQLAWIMSGEKG
jgi:hypothetical protein